MTQSGELRLVGGMAVVKTKETPREKVVAAFLRAMATDTGEQSDEAFEAALDAAFRAVDAYNLARGWKPPEKTARPPTLSLFAAE